MGLKELYENSIDMKPKLNSPQDITKRSGENFVDVLNEYSVNFTKNVQYMAKQFTNKAEKFFSETLLKNGVGPKADKQSYTPDNKYGEPK